jgi:hypothetical protein
VEAGAKHCASQVMHIRWGQGLETRIIPDDLLMSAVQKSMLATDAMAARLDTLTEELAALRRFVEANLTVTLTRTRPRRSPRTSSIASAPPACAS